MMMAGMQENRLVSYPDIAVCKDDGNPVLLLEVLHIRLHSWVAGRAARDDHNWPGNALWFRLGHLGETLHLPGHYG